MHEKHHNAGLWAACAAILLLRGCTVPSPGGMAEPINPNPDGTVSTIAGNGDAGFGGDGGRSALAQLNSPMAVTLSADAAVLIADFMNHRIRRIDLTTGFINGVAGDGTTGGAGGLNSPTGVTVLKDGGFLAASWGENRVYRYAADGTRSILAGDGGATCADVSGGPQATGRPVAGPRSAAVLADGSVLVSEQACHRVVRIKLDGSILPYAGTGVAGYSGDGSPALLSELHAGPVEDGPAFGSALSPEDPPDELFIADTGNHVIRVVKPFTGRIDTFAGTGAAGFRDGPPGQAMFNRPTHLYCSRDHSLWIADSGNHAIRYIDPLRTRVSTVAGTGTAGFNGDGLPPTETLLNHPCAVWVAGDGRVFIADTGNHRIRLFQNQ